MTVSPILSPTGLITAQLATLFLRHKGYVLMLTEITGKLSNR